MIDEKNLKNQIKTSQSERERIDLLMSEYLDDNSISHSERAIESRQESLWELVNDLVEIFEWIIHYPTHYFRNIHLQKCIKRDLVVLLHVIQMD